MTRGSTEEASNFNSALCAVYGSSLGLMALMGRNPKFRAITALAGVGLLIGAAMNRRAPQLSARTRSTHMDRTLEESFPASDPPGWSSPDVPPSNAEAKWQAYREAGEDSDGV